MIENGNFRSHKPLMHGNIILHGGDLNENEHVKEWTRIIHGYKKCRGDLKENDNDKKTQNGDII